MSCDDSTRAGSDVVPRGRLLPFPQLGTLRSVARMTTQERVEARLAAFYDAVEDQMGDTPLPYTTDVWIHPRDEAVLRRWVEAPAAEGPTEEPTEYLRQFTAWHWRVIGPSVSARVPLGHVIVTPRGTSKR